jgi:hypothetical protein
MAMEGHKDLDAHYQYPEKNILLDAVRQKKPA